MAPNFKYIKYKIIPRVHFFLICVILLINDVSSLAGFMKFKMAATLRTSTNYGDAIVMISNQKILNSVILNF